MSDLRAFRKCPRHTEPWVHHVFGDGCNGGALEDATLSDVVAYLTEQGAEVVDTDPLGVMGRFFDPGRYLVYRVPVLVDSTQPREESHDAAASRPSDTDVSRR